MTSFSLKNSKERILAIPSKALIYGTRRRRSILNFSDCAVRKKLNIHTDVCKKYFPTDPLPLPLFSDPIYHYWVALIGTQLALPVLQSSGFSNRQQPALFIQSQTNTVTYKSLLSAQTPYTQSQHRPKWRTILQLSHTEKIKIIILIRRFEQRT